MAAIAKKATPAAPYIVANELICSMIARVMLLPCPPGALVEHAGETYFCSLDFNTAGHALPPASPSVVVADCPEFSWGIILFDILVMNSDRHPHNLSYNQTTRTITIFDHSHAFMQPNGDVDAIIAANKGIPAIGGHCLSQEISQWKGYAAWISRIGAIPDYYMEGVIEEGCQIGLPPAKKSVIYDFIRNRRDTIDAIVINNKGIFPKLTSQKP
jgi:hypothetical protein